MEAGLLTAEQKDLIAGQQFAPNCYFNPIQDIDNNWIISIQEMENAIYFEWVKTLPLINFNKKPNENNLF